MSTHVEGTPCGCRTGNACPYVNAEHTDAALTQRGRLQATAAGPRMLMTAPVPEVLFVSPLTRALQTATIALSSARGLRVPVICDELLRERNGVHVCDMRSPVDALLPAFPTVDFRTIAPGTDPLFQPTVRETVEQLADRGKRFFWSLKDRPEDSIAVFSHSSFLLNTLTHAFLTPDPTGMFRERNHMLLCTK